MTYIIINNYKHLVAIMYLYKNSITLKHFNIKKTKSQNDIKSKKKQFGLTILCNNESIKMNNTSSILANQELIFVIDRSESMNAHFKNKINSVDLHNEQGFLSQYNKTVTNKHDIIKKALMDALTFVNIKNKNMKISIITFNHIAVVHHERIKLTNNNLDIIMTNISGYTYPCGGTNIKLALDEAIRISKIIKKENKQVSTFLLTDGYDSNKNRQTLIDSFCSSGLNKSCICIGIGDETEYDCDLLTQLSSEEQVYGVNSSKDANNIIVGTTFSTCSAIASDISIYFPKSIDISSPLPVNKTPTNMIVSCKTFDHSQQIPIHISNIGSKYIYKSKKKMEAFVNIPITLCYCDKLDKNITINTFIKSPLQQNLDTNEITECDLVRILCEIPKKYSESVKVDIDSEISKKLINECYDALQSWSVNKRQNHYLADMWNSYQDIINPHHENLSMPINISLPPTPVSTPIYRSDASRLKACKLPRLSSKAAYDAITPVIKNRTLSSPIYNIVI